MKYLVIVVSIAVAAGFGWWTTRPKVVADISAEKAKAIAETAITEFCGMENADCGEFFLQGEAPPADARFRWGFRYQTYAPPIRRVVVSVSGKGEKSISFSLPSPEETTPP